MQEEREFRCGKQHCVASCDSTGDPLPVTWTPSKCSQNLCLHSLSPPASHIPLLLPLFSVPYRTVAEIFGETHIHKLLFPACRQVHLLSSLRHPNSRGGKRNKVTPSIIDKDQNQCFAMPFYWPDFLSSLVRRDWLKQKRDSKRKKRSRHRACYVQDITCPIALSHPALFPLVSLSLFSSKILLNMIGGWCCFETWCSWNRCTWLQDHMKQRRMKSMRSFFWTTARHVTRLSANTHFPCFSFCCETVFVSHSLSLFLLRETSLYTRFSHLACYLSSVETHFDRSIVSSLFCLPFPADWSRKHECYHTFNACRVPFVAVGVLFFPCRSYINVSTPFNTVYCIL